MTLSTGYIQGTVPPQFSDENKKPIDLLGSDGIVYLDNRLSLNNMIEKGFNVLNKHIKKKSIVGFKVIAYNRSIQEKERILKSITL
jgi:hypothetical protein